MEQKQEGKTNSHSESSLFFPKEETKNEEKTDLTKFLQIKRLQKEINKVSLTNSELQEELQNYDRWIEKARNEIFQYFAQDYSSSELEYEYEEEEEEDTDVAEYIEENEEEEEKSKKTISATASKPKVSNIGMETKPNTKAAVVPLNHKINGLNGYNAYQKSAIYGNQVQKNSYNPTNAVYSSISGFVPNQIYPTNGLYPNMPSLTTKINLQPNMFPNPSYNVSKSCVPSIGNVQKMKVPTEYKMKETKAPKQYKMKEIQTPVQIPMKEPFKPLKYDPEITETKNLKYLPPPPRDLMDRYMMLREYFKNNKRPVMSQI